MGWEFAALLAGAMLLGGLFTFWQQRYYNSTLQTMAAEHHERGKTLVSGRGRSPLRGAIVVMVVDSRSRRVIDARAMIGSTVFARFRPAPELHGPLSTAPDRARNNQLRRAVEEAQLTFKSTSRPSRRH